MIVVDWATRIVFIPENEATISTVVSVSPAIYTYDLNLLRLELKDIEDSPQGMAHPPIQSHTKAFTVGNVQLAKVMGMINGYTIEFEDGQYLVQLAGGNTDYDQPVNRVINQVSVTNQNSAGLITTASTIDLISSAVWEALKVDHVSPASMGSALNVIAYDNKIWVDPLNITGNAAAGQVPGINGLHSSPCLNFTDAKVLAAAFSFYTYGIISDAILDAPFPNARFDGLHAASLDTAGFNVTGTEFHTLRLIGQNNGLVTATGCVLDGNTDICGSYIECGLVGTNTIALGEAILDRCWSQEITSASPLLDFQGINGALLALRGYSGGIELTEMTDAGCFATMDLDSGQIILGPTNTLGTVVCHGVAVLTDTSSMVNVDDDGLVSKSAITNEVWEEPQVNHNTPDTMGSFVGGLDYDGNLWVDTVGGGSAGAVVNVNGTRTNPVNNITDLDTLRTLTGFRGTRLKGAITFTTPQPDTTWKGIGANSSVVFAGQNINGSTFKELSVIGAAAPSVGLFFQNTPMIGVGNIQCIALNCQLIGTTTLVAGGSNVTAFIECLAGDAQPVIDLQGSALTALNMPLFGGNIEIKGLTNPGTSVAISLINGVAFYGPTNTAGVLIMSGAAGAVVNTGSSGVTVIDNIFNPSSVAEAVIARTSYSKRDNIAYNANGFPISGRERLFPSEALASAATYGGVGEGEVDTYTITATPDGTFPLAPATFDKVRDV